MNETDLNWPESRSVITNGKSVFLKIDKSTFFTFAIAVILGIVFNSVAILNIWTGQQYEQASIKVITDDMNVIKTYISKQDEAQREFYIKYGGALDYAKKEMNE